jgi:predicted nucleotide-binding protein (sugar kinase/HSP70/actin superfamily)
MYGHVAFLAEHYDFIFMPVYLESRIKPKNTEQNFCYYTQYSTSLAYLEGEHVRKKLISPMVNFHKSSDHNVKLLLKSLKQMGYKSLTSSDVSRALKEADAHVQRYDFKLKQLYKSTFTNEEDVSVVLLGRPYVVLSETLNKGIPDIFTRMGINAAYQDMLHVDHQRDEAFNNLLGKIPWYFASNILRAAEVIGRTPNLYPVLITAFKCAPDSFIIEYFKQLMNLFGKPYLIIQIDEHDSNVGYETRIEAALRSFRNHAKWRTSQRDPNLGSILPRVETSMNGKILLMPNWDMFVSPLLAANLRRAGVDARLLEPTELGIRKSMVHNTGQCLPINIVAQNYIDYIEKYQLDPSQTLLWMMEGRGTCNLRQYPYYIKRILENYGKGFEKASVYSGELTHRELSVSVTYYAYFAYMLGGLFRKTACRIRPYEVIPGRTDEVFKEVHKILVNALSGEHSIDQAIRDGIKLLDEIEYDKTYRKPLVAIFGDLYVRDNDIMNQDLVRDIENAGGEVLETPYHEYAKISIENIFRRAYQRGEHVETSLNRILLNVLKFMDEIYYRSFTKYLSQAPVIKPNVLEKHLTEFNISLFVQTNPSFCCPALVTEAMTRQIRELTGVPVVTINYDGTSDRMNDLIVPFIQKASTTL